MEQDQNQAWYLSYDELILLKNKSFPHKLAFAVQLKQNMYTGSFPGKKSGLVNVLTSHLSEQLETNESILNGYNWSSRTAYLGNCRYTNFNVFVNGNGLGRTKKTFLLCD